MEASIPAENDSDAKMNVQSTQTIEARLLQTRRRLTEFIRPRKDHNPDENLTSSSVCHPFYSVHKYRNGESIERGLTRSFLRSTISECRKGLKTFLTDAEKEDPSLGNVNVFSTNGVADGDDDEMIKKSNQMKSLIVSSLREQTNHSLAITRVRDRLEQITEIHEGEQNSSWETLANNFLSPEENIANLWPTKDLAIASNGLDNLVRSLEGLAKEMGLEAFSERHEEEKSQDRLSGYTLTFAAHIPVIDVDLSIEADQETQIFVPNAKVRISYATDASQAESKHRNASLAKLVEEDIKAIARTQFGLDDGKNENRRKALKHLFRLKSTVKDLKRLDGLSKIVTLDGYADLFAVMEDKGTETLIRIISSDTSLDSIKFLKDDFSPHASLIYYLNPSQASKSSEELKEDYLNKNQIISHSIHTLKMDIDTCSLLAKAQSSDAEDVLLPTLKSSIPDSNYQFVIRLQPALPIQISEMRRISSFLGIEMPSIDQIRSSIDKGDRSFSGTDLLSFFQAPQGKQDSQIQIRFAANDDVGQNDKQDAILLNMLPIASYSQICAIIPILQKQARLNNILSTLVHSTEEGDSKLLLAAGNQGIEAIIFIRREGDSKTPFIAIEIFTKKDQKKIMTAKIKDNGVSQTSLEIEWNENDHTQPTMISEKETEKLVTLLNSPDGGLRQVINKLVKFVNENPEDQEMIQSQKKQPSRNIKRRASAAGITNEDEEDIRPSNRPRNED